MQSLSVRRLSFSFSFSYIKVPSLHTYSLETSSSRGAARRRRIELATAGCSIDRSDSMLTRDPLSQTNTYQRIMTATTMATTNNAGNGPATKQQKTANNNEPVLLVKKLSENATLPVRGSAGAAGYDLASAEDTVIPARGKGIVKTDLSIAAPPGTYARIAPRSGLAVKKFIDTGAGVVDEDYRGAVGVVLFNHSDEDFEVKKGDRVAQMILERIMTPEVVEVESLDDTTRGAGGYGSTGV